jgi:hypothetical protein
MKASPHTLSAFSFKEGGAEKPGEASASPKLKCYCTALADRARRIRQGDIPCDGSYCALRRQEIEGKSQQP